MLRKIVRRLEWRGIKEADVTEYFEKMFFYTYFEDDVPPSLMNNTRNPRRSRILKGVGPSVLVERKGTATIDIGADRVSAVFVDSDQTVPCFVKRAGWGDLRHIPRPKHLSQERLDEMVVEYMDDVKGLLAKVDEFKEKVK